MSERRCVLEGLADRGNERGGVLERLADRGSEREGVPESKYGATGTPLKSGVNGWVFWKG